MPTISIKDTLLPIIILISFLLTLYFIFTNYVSYSINERIIFGFLLLTVLLSPLGDFILIPLIGTIIASFFNKEIRISLLTKFNTIDYIWLIFIIFCIIHSFFIPTIDKTSAIGISFAFLGYGILFKLGRYFPLPKQIQTDLSIVFSATLIITILFAFIHYFYPNRIEIINGFTLYTDPTPRLTSILSEWAANAAGFLVLAFSIVFYQLFFVPQDNKRKLFLLFTLILTFVAILATETRMSFLFIIGFLTFFIIFYPFQQFKKIRFLIPIIPLFFLPLLFQYSQKWHDTLTNPFKQTTIADRLHQYQYGLSLWSEHPISGVGLMNFRFLYDQYGDPLIKKLQPGHGRIEFLHNIYLSFLVETGIFGFILFLSTIFILLLTFYNYRPKLPAYFGLYFLAGLLCVGLVDSWFFVLKFAIMIFPILGVTVQFCEQKD